MCSRLAIQTLCPLRDDKGSLKTHAGKERCEQVGRLIRKGAHARLVLSVDLIGQAVSVEVDAADVRAY